MYELVKLIAVLSALFPHKMGPYPVVTKLNYLEDGWFVEVGQNTGPNVDLEFAETAINLMNRAVSSGCLKQKVLGHKFKSLGTVTSETVGGSAEAYDRFVSGAPYALDLRWYSKRFTKVVGYTYNYKDNNPSSGTETRIWTNTRKMGDAKAYASHLTHELSHQVRAGGFTHYTVLVGSFPYDIGDLMSQCIQEHP